MRMEEQRLSLSLSLKTIITFDRSLEILDERGGLVLHEVSIVSPGISLITGIV